ncbi:MAG: hypothetical protein QOE53_1241 [Pseudonocardiales bacterium]|jgi:hypothetical protein|nr:hypothetical protein [Pseudonocardiales bacterium]
MHYRACCRPSGRLRGWWRTVLAGPPSSAGTVWDIGPAPGADGSNPRTSAGSPASQPVHGQAGCHRLVHSHRAPTGTSANRRSWCWWRTQIDDRASGTIVRMSTNRPHAPSAAPASASVQTGLGSRGRRWNASSVTRRDAPGQAAEGHPAPGRVTADPSAACADPIVAAGTRDHRAGVGSVGPGHTSFQPTGCPRSQPGPRFATGCHVPARSASIPGHQVVFDVAARFITSFDIRIVMQRQ